MKHLKTAAAMALVSVLFACEPAVTFTEPQPVSSKDLSSFPKRLRGFYINRENQVTLTISDRVIQQSYDYERTLHSTQLDSASSIVGDSMVEYPDGTTIPLTRKGDSLVLQYHFTDTLFMIDYDNVVRKLKGYYFINTRYGKNSWEVKKIGLHKGRLTISSITAPSDIANLQAITETTEDTIAPYRVSPGKKQFKKFVKEGGFSDEDVYLKYDPE